MYSVDPVNRFPMICVGHCVSKVIDIYGNCFFFQLGIGECFGTLEPIDGRGENSR